jgi:predicted nuclease with TOPRIM domain
MSHIQFSELAIGYDNLDNPHRWTELLYNYIVAQQTRLDEMEDRTHDDVKRLEDRIFELENKTIEMDNKISTIDFGLTDILINLSQIEVDVFEDGGDNSKWTKLITDSIKLGTRLKKEIKYLKNN